MARAMGRDLMERMERMDLMGFMDLIDLMDFMAFAMFLDLMNLMGSMVLMDLMAAEASGRCKLRRSGCTIQRRSKICKALAPESDECSAGSRQRCIALAPESGRFVTTKTNSE